MIVARRVVGVDDVDELELGVRAAGGVEGHEAVGDGDPDLGLLEQVVVVGTKLSMATTPLTLTRWVEPVA